jgi:hypothetical protein
MNTAVLAELSGVPFIDLAESPPDPAVLTGARPDSAGPAGLDAGPRAGRRHDATDWDIRRALTSGLRQDILDQAALGLWQRSAAASARTALYPRQKAAVLAALAATAVGWPSPTRPIPGR